MKLIFIISVLSANAFAQSVRVVKLNDKRVATIFVSSQGTVLSFPSKPTKVILGRKGSFGIDYVDDDLAISPLRSDARSNLFVYVLGVRFSFHLITSMSSETAVIDVRDLYPSKQTRKSDER